MFEIVIIFISKARIVKLFGLLKSAILILRVYLFFFVKEQKI
jgi:hypothetical protein